jgi:hypothetical protein
MLHVVIGYGHSTAPQGPFNHAPQKGLASASASAARGTTLDVSKMNQRAIRVAYW